MNISVVNEAEKLIIKVAGRLDTSTYSQLQDTIDGLDFSSVDVLFDFKELQYISSAGLRVLLAARKKAKDGNMKLVNMSEDVFEVFKMTGFDTIMDIELAQASASPEEFMSMSFKEVIAKLASDSPDKVFLKHKGITYTWQEIDRCSEIIASDLRKLGVKKGSHVGLCTPNCANWAFAFFAIQKLGAVACLLNFNYTAEELKLVSNVGDITHICYGDISLTRDGSDFPNNVLNQPDSMLTHAYDIRTSVDFKQRLSEYDAIEDKKGPEVSSDDVCVMIYTSGSTGMPKGVLLSAYNILNSSEIRAKTVGINSSDKLCLILPLFHTFGISAGFFCNALHGGSIVIPDDGHVHTVLETIEKEKCTLFHSVPTMILALMGNREFTPEKVSSLRCINVGGASFSKAQFINASKAFPNVHFIVSYGLSEATPSTLTEYNDGIDRICDSVGKPIACVELKVVNPESGEECPTGTAGEIMIRGQNLMCSYYKLPLEKQAIDEYGWLHSGDMGCLDDDGYLHFLGRYKELIIRGGENIMPNEVGAVISQHEAVQDVKVVGVPDYFYGEVVCACISMKEGCSFDENEMRAFLNGKLSKHKIPAYFLIYDTLPKLANGKQDAVRMKREAAAKFAKQD